MVVHLGPRGGWRIPHHVISFGDAWRTTFDELIDRGHTMSDPSLLITRPTASDPRLAPEGHDLISVLAGGGTVPGVGVPTALISGRPAADRITGVPAHRRRTVIAGGRPR